MSTNNNLEKSLAKFYQKFQELAIQKNSLLVAGIDTITTEMEQGQVYPSSQSKLDFSIDFIKNVSEFCVGAKINLGYWQDEQDGKNLLELVKYCNQKELLVILDGKYSDIAASNDAWIFYAKKLGVDAITVAPFAANIATMVTSSHKQNLAIFTMGLMSNPEFQKELHFQNQQGIKLYEYRILEALHSQVDGFVIGATYSENSSIVKNFLKLTKNKNILYLIPGVGSQLGSIQNLHSWGIDFRRCLISISRSLIFAKDRDFSDKKIRGRQKQAAKFYQAQINQYKN